MRPAYTQHAEGSFHCTLVPGTNHCGIDDTDATFKYAVDIEYTSRDALDDKGFLLDNLTFRSYFNSLGAVRISCEEVAHAACEYFKGLLAPRMKFVASIRVRIFPFEGVWVESCINAEAQS